jgi:choline dehydrogenase
LGHRRCPSKPPNIHPHARQTHHLRHQHARHRRRSHHLLPPLHHSRKPRSHPLRRRHPHSSAPHGLRYRIGAPCSKTSPIPLLNLPGVGQNLWDPILFIITHHVNLQQGGSLQNPANFLAAAEEYTTNRSGPLTNTGFDFVARKKLPSPSPANLSANALSELSFFRSDWPNLEFIISDASNPNDTNSYSSIIGALVSPLSRGSVTITSNDTNDLPAFDPGWLTHPTDQEVAIQSFRRCRIVFATSAIQPILIGDEFIPGAAVQTDEEILEFLKKSVTTVYHASCTCKMGVESDEMAVIVSRARLFGTKNLKVVDASSLPMLLPGHPSATVYTFAEKIADDILRGR